MAHLNLISSRSRRLTACAALARDVRHSRVAVLDAIDAIETAADIAVEVVNHQFWGGRSLSSQLRRIPSA